MIDAADDPISRADAARALSTLLPPQIEPSHHQGALVHYSENNFTGRPPSYTIAPWIAMIDCDAAVSSPTVNPSTDILTQVRRLGAQTAILYSGTGRTCMIDPIFARAINGSYDVYVTTSRTSYLSINKPFS